MRYLVKVFLFFVFLNVTAKLYASDTSVNETVEKYIIENKLDSASYYLKKVEKGVYYNLYSKLINKEPVSYSELYTFVSRLGNRHSVNYEIVSEFINNQIQEPTNEKEIDLDYVEIKWTQITKLRDEVSLDKASLEQSKLEKYISKFNQSDKEVIKAKTKITTHPIVMYLIQRDVEKGKNLCLKNIEIAKKLQDKELEIIFLYHLSDFLVLERDLDGYIEVSEKSLLLEKELPRESSYYHATIEHLIDAYIFKGGNNERVLDLIDIIYKDDDTRLYTYIYYVKLISKLDKNSILVKEVFDKFDAKDIPNLIEKLEVLGKDLNPNDLSKYYNASASTLARHGFYPESLNYKNKEIETVKKIYSEDLSKSLASFRTQQVVKEKEKEILFEKEKTKLYSVIAVLAILFSFFSVMIIIKIKKQSKDLKDKNILINKTLKEKELLVKEVHHRVKNNFQIVSSLLELQTKGISDKKALALANEGKNRVKSMAIIHQKLYQNESGLIDFEEYLNLLTNEISTLYKSKSIVEISIESENIMLDVDTAIPLGLIINEIVTNSFKYAFINSDKKNTISIILKKENDNTYKLVVEDNGSGIPENIDVSKADSLGLKLINRLVKQLQGSIIQTNENGSKFTIYFKDDEARKMIN